MLVPMRAILEAADKGNYAQGAFNVNAVCQIKAAVEVHEMLRSPALLQGADLANGFMGGCAEFAQSTLEDKKTGAKNIADAVRKYGQDSRIPVAIHLDHGRDFDSCVAAVEGGYTSVMIDASALPYDENVELTREVVKYAHARGVTVEGELGVLAGVEDDVFAETSTYTNPLTAIDFFRKTGCDALAISYGTKHGANKGKDAKIRKEIVIAIKECMRHEHIDGFLVSHGSSTVPEYIVSELNALGGKITNAYGIDVSQLVGVAHCGINKINVDTDLRLAVTRNLRELFAFDPSLQSSASIGGVYELLMKYPEKFDPRVFFVPLMDMVMYGNEKDTDVQRLSRAVEDGVKEALAPLIVKFGSYGKAPQVEAVSLEEMAQRYKNAGI